MSRQAPSLPFSLFLLIAGLLLIYFVFHANRGNAADFMAMWNDFAVVPRLITIVGFAATAYGFGGILNRLLLRRR